MEAVDKISTFLILPGSKTVALLKKGPGHQKPREKKPQANLANLDLLTERSKLHPESWVGCLLSQLLPGSPWSVCTCGRRTNTM